MELVISLIKAFLIGGVICVAAQILIDKTALTPARILVLYVSLGVALTAVGLYGPLVDFAGCGATTPLLGFGYSLAEGVKKGGGRARPCRCACGRTHGNGGRNCRGNLFRIPLRADLPKPSEKIIS